MLSCTLFNISAGEYNRQMYSYFRFRLLHILCHSGFFVKILFFLWRQRKCIKIITYTFTCTFISMHKYTKWMRFLRLFHNAVVIERRIIYITTRIFMTGDLKWKWKKTAVTYLRHCRKFLYNTEEGNSVSKKI